MSEKFESRWERILGLILESEGINKYTIPEKPYIEATSANNGTGRIIYYYHFEYECGGIKYKIITDMHYKYENDADKYKNSQSLEVDPQPAANCNDLISILINKILNKLAYEYKSQMMQILE